MVKRNPIPSVGEHYRRSGEHTKLSPVHIVAWDIRKRNMEDKNYERYYGIITRGNRTV